MMREQEKMPVKKELVMLYLNRWTKVAEARASFDQEAAARRGMTIEMRRKMTADAEDAKKEHECMLKVATIVEAYDDW